MSFDKQCHKYFYVGKFSIPHVFFLCVILGRFYCYVFKFPVFSSAISILLLIPSNVFSL